MANNTKDKKIKSIFDHASNLYSKNKHWNDMDESEIKAFSVFVLNRILSMNTALIDFLNEFQYLTLSSMSDKEVWYLYWSLIPKGNSYYPYIKKDKEHNKEPKVIETLINYFEVSKREVFYYLNFLTDEQVIDILKKYGYNDKEIKALLK